MQIKKKKTNFIKILTTTSLKNDLFIFYFLFLLFQDECVYILYVKTGSIIKSGTDSNITVTLSDTAGKSVRIQNLKDWGLMSLKYNYFERGNLDIFSGRAPCIGSPICKLNVTSNGSGQFPGWYCEYVQVTATGPHKSCSQTGFYVDQWLATDAPPYQLSTVLDGCSKEEEGGPGPLVVRRKPVGGSTSEWFNRP